MPEIRLPELNAPELPSDARIAEMSGASDALNQALEKAQEQLESLSPEILERVANADSASAELHELAASPSRLPPELSLPDEVAPRALAATQDAQGTVAELSLPDDLWDRFEASLPGVNAATEASMAAHAPVTTHESASAWPDVQANPEAFQHVPGANGDPIIHTFDWTSHLG